MCKLYIERKLCDFGEILLFLFPSINENLCFSLRLVNCRDQVNSIFLKDFDMNYVNSDVKLLPFVFIFVDIIMVMSWFTNGELQVCGENGIKIWMKKIDACFTGFLFNDVFMNKNGCRKDINRIWFGWRKYFSNLSRKQFFNLKIVFF